MKNIKQFRVKIAIPEGVSVVEMKEYIRESVSSWAGSLHPDEPLFDLNRKSVKVTSLRRMR